MQYDPQLTQSSHEVNRSIRECDEQGGLSSTSTRGKTIVYIAIDIEWGNKFWGTMQGALHSKITILCRLASFPTNHSSVPLIIFSSISRSCFGWIGVADSTPFTHLISPQEFSAQRSASASTSPPRRDRTDRNLSRAHAIRHHLRPRHNRLEISGFSPPLRSDAACPHRQVAHHATLLARASYILKVDPLAGKGEFGR